MHRKMNNLKDLIEMIKMIYVWLEYTKKMITFDSIEEYTEHLDNLPDFIRGHGEQTVMIEKNTKQWND